MKNVLKCVLKRFSSGTARKFIIHINTRAPIQGEGQGQGQRHERVVTNVYTMSTHSECDMDTDTVVFVSQVETWLALSREGGGVCLWEWQLCVM